MYFTISSSGNICSIKLGVVEILFVSVSSKSISLAFLPLVIHHFQFVYMGLDCQLSSH